MAFVNERTETGQYITIDRQKDLLLTYTDQIAEEQIYIFDFSKQGKTFKVFAQRKIAFQDVSRFITWTITKLYPDISFDKNFSEIELEITAALFCYGASGAAELNPEKNKEIKVNFSL